MQMHAISHKLQGRENYFDETGELWQSEQIHVGSSINYIQWLKKERFLLYIIL